MPRRKSRRSRKSSVRKSTKKYISKAKSKLKSKVKSLFKSKAKSAGSKLKSFAKKYLSSKRKSSIKRFSNKKLARKVLFATVKSVKKNFVNKRQSSISVPGNVKPFDEYPILGYKFDVVFTIDGTTYNSAFQSISGISKSTKVTKIQEGGDYEREYHLPGEFSYKDATFKRGVLRNFGDKYPADLQFWFETLGWQNGNRIKTAEIEIHVKDFNQQKQRVTVETITLSNAYPTSVSMGELDSQKSEVFLETITLSFSSYARNRSLIEVPDQIPMNSIV